MKRLRRWLARLVLVAAVVIAAIVIGGKLYLATPRGGAQIAVRLAEVLGGRVSIAGIDAGLSGSTIRDLELFEAGPDAPDTPWIAVPSVRAELPLLDAVRGDLPRSLTLYDASILLRFDRDGRLLTRFPDSAGKRGTLPAVHLVAGQLTIRQEGRVDFVIHDITADLRQVGDALQLTATAADSTLGTWEVAGTLDAAQTSTLALKSAAFPLTPALLARLPFIPPATAEQVTLEGVTPATLTVRYDPAEEQVHYRAELTPESMRTSVSAIHLPLEQAHGRIVIDDGLVRLHDVRGWTAGGTLTAAGTLDFRGDVGLLDLSVRMERLDLQKLPALWAIPDWVEGQFRGTAALRIRIADGRAQFRGDGTGTITTARLAGIAAEPIPVWLRDDQLESALTIHDADPAPLLRRFAVTMPVNGRVNVRTTLAIPLATPLDRKTYRLSGTAQLPWVRLSGTELVQVRTDLRAADGVLHLEGLRATFVPDEGAQSIPLTGSAAVELESPYRITSALTLPPTVQSYRLPAGAELQGTVQATAQVQGTLQPLTAQANGTVQADAVQVGERTLGQLTARWETSGEQLRVTEIRLSDGASAVVGSATLPLAADARGGLNLRFTDFESGVVAAEVPALPVPVRGAVSGTLQADIGPAVSDQPRPLSGKLTLQAPRLRVGELPVTKLDGSAEYRNGQLDYQFGGEVLGGQLTLDGKGREGRLRLQRARLTRAGAVLALPLGRQGLRGTLDLDVIYRPNDAGDALTGAGRFVLSRLRWQAAALADMIQGEVVINGPAVRVRNLNGSIAGGILSGDIGYNLQQPQRRWLRASLQGADLARLVASWPALADGLQGTVNAQVRASLGREWHGNADVTIQRGQLYGAELTEVRVPVEFSYSPAADRGQLEVREAQAQLARGRVQGQVSLRWGDETRLDGKLRFFGLQLHPLLRGLPEVSQRVDNGDLAGWVDFSATRLESLDDLTATLEATLRNGQVLDLPVLRQIAPFVAPGRSLTAFSTGELRARLARGIVRVERLDLAGTAAQAHIDGTVTLAGRLALDVTANPGLPGADLPVLRQLGLRLPGTGLVPANIVNQASRILTGRLVRLRVVGTVRDPVVQVVPLGALSGDVLRLVLGWAAR